MFSNLNILNITIFINNRKVLSGMVELMNSTNLFNDIVIAIDKLDKIGIAKVKEEMSEKGVSNDSFLILDKFLSVNNISELKELLTSSEIGTKGVEELEFVFGNVERLGLKTSQLNFDITLARGIDYYTGSILEVKQSDVKIGSVGGGGRYDDLTSVFGLKDVSGVGISFGIDRIYIVMEDLGLFPKDIDTTTKVLIINFGPKEELYCLNILKELRESGISSELYPDSSKMKKQMNYADKKGIEFVIMIGENEMKSGKISVKQMNTGNQKEITISEFIKELI